MIDAESCWTVWLPYISHPSCIFMFIWWLLYSSWDTIPFLTTVKSRTGKFPWNIEFSGAHIETEMPHHLNETYDSDCHHFRPLWSDKPSSGSFTIKSQLPSFMKRKLSCSYIAIEEGKEEGGWQSNGDIREAYFFRMIFLLSQFQQSRQVPVHNSEYNDLFFCLRLKLL